MTEDRSPEKHGSGAGDDHQLRMTTNQLEQKTVEVPQEQIEKTDTNVNTESSAERQWR